MDKALEYCLKRGICNPNDPDTFVFSNTEETVVINIPSVLDKFVKWLALENKHQEFSTTPEWLDDGTREYARRLWENHKPRDNNRVEAVKAIQERAKFYGYTLGINKALEIVKEFCLKK